MQGSMKHQLSTQKGVLRQCSLKESSTDHLFLTTQAQWLSTLQWPQTPFYLNVYCRCNLTRTHSAGAETVVYAVHHCITSSQSAPGQHIMLLLETLWYIPYTYCAIVIHVHALPPKWSQSSFGSGPCIINCCFSCTNLYIAHIEEIDIALDYSVHLNSLQFLFLTFQ